MTSASQGGGGWVPDLYLVSSTGASPWWLEMLLTMWTYYGFMAACWVGSFRFSPFASPGVFDHADRRRSLVRLQLEELLSSGEKYHMRMPVTSAVCDRLVELEDRASGVSNNNSNTLFISELSRLVEEHHFKSKNGSIHEARYWVVRYLTVLSIINALYFLFIH